MHASPRLSTGWLMEKIAPCEAAAAVMASTVTIGSADPTRKSTQRVAPIALAWPE